MTRLELTPEEASMLSGILASYLSDLRMEIAKTEEMAFREELKARERFLKALLGQLEA